MQTNNELVILNAHKFLWVSTFFDQHLSLHTSRCSTVECHASCEHPMPLIIITPMVSNEFLRPTNIFGLYNPLSMTTLLNALKSKQVYASCSSFAMLYIYIAFIHPFKTILKTQTFGFCATICVFKVLKCILYTIDVKSI